MPKNTNPSTIRGKIEKIKTFQMKFRWKGNINNLILILPMAHTINELIATVNSLSDRLEKPSVTEQLVHKEVEELRKNQEKIKRLHKEYSDRLSRLEQRDLSQVEGKLEVSERK